MPREKEFKKKQENIKEQCDNFKRYNIIRTLEKKKYLK